MSVKDDAVRFLVNVTIIVLKGQRSHVTYRTAPVDLIQWTPLS